MSSDFCWLCEASSCLIVGLASCERLLRRLGDLVDLEDVVAELRLDRAGELALGGREDGVVEGLLLLALGDRGELAALRLGGLVDRVLLGDGLPGVAALDRRLGGVGLGLGLGQDDEQVTPLGLGEALLVLVVVLLDLGVGDLVLALGDLLADLVREDVEPDAQEDVLHRLAGVLEELVEVGLLREDAFFWVSNCFLTSASETLTPRSSASPWIHWKEISSCRTWSRSASYSCLHCVLSCASVVLGWPLAGSGSVLRLLAMQALNYGGCGMLAACWPPDLAAIVIQWSKLDFSIAVAVDGGHTVAGDPAAAREGSCRDRHGAGERGELRLIRRDVMSWVRLKASARLRANGSGAFRPRGTSRGARR